MQGPVIKTHEGRKEGGQVEEGYKERKTIYRSSEHTHSFNSCLIAGGAGRPLRAATTRRRILWLSNGSACVQ